MRLPFAMLALAAGLGGCASLGGASGPATPRIDYHQHLVSPAFAPIVKFPEMDGQALVARLDAAGMEKAVALSMGYSFSDERKKLPDPAGLTRAENDWTARQVVASGGRLIGFCGVNPLRPEALSEIDRCLSLPGMRGLKLHLGNSGVTLRDPDHVARMEEVFALLQRRGAPVLIHMRARGGKDFGAPDAQIFLDRLVPRAPDVEIIVAHFGGAGPGYPEQADEVMGVFAVAAERGDPRLRNLYFDMATILVADSTPEEGARAGRRVRQLGPKRILFGSDMAAPGAPSLSDAWTIFRTKAGLSETEARVIAGNRLRFTR
ncbi:amidohydrolase family protein [Phenylobacterium deserti]|nr:amidohydrolase family protein [Phenylobacterium deserti]